MDGPSTTQAPPPEVSIASDETEATEAAVAVPEQPQRSRLGVLRHRHYRNIWLGQFGSSIGGWMESVGVAWIINITTDRPALALGYLAVAQLSPMMVLGIPGGLLADRVNRKMLLLVTQGIMMLIAAALAVASYVFNQAPSHSLLIGLIALNGVAMAFNAPAWQVLTPRLVPREELTNAIFLNGLQFNLARVIGPALGGLLLSWQGPTALFAINTLSFVGVLIAISSTPNTPTPPRVAASVWARTREALAFVLASRGPRAAFLAIIVFGLFSAPLMRFLPAFITEVFDQTRDAPKHTQEIVFGWLLAVMGIGAVLGVVFMRWVPKWYPKHHFIPASILGGGICIALFSATTSIYFAAAALLCCGIFWLWAFNSAFAAMQLLVPDHMRGRVMSVLNVAVFGAMAIGPLIAGGAGEAIGGHSESGDGSGIGLQVSVGATGLILTVAALIMLAWRTPEVDGLRPGDPGYDRTPGLIAGLTARAHRPGK